MATKRIRVSTTRQDFAKRLKLANVVFGGQNPVERPRVRTREGQEVELESYSRSQISKRTLVPHFIDEVFGVCCASLYAT
jgi:hypothetical protein